MISVRSASVCGMGAFDGRVLLPQRYHGPGPVMRNLGGMKTDVSARWMANIMDEPLEQVRQWLGQ
jgi:hypothetical protein